MKYFLMILVAMAFVGCSFDYKSPDKMASDMAGDTLADSQDSHDSDGEDGEEVEFTPPLPESDSGPPPIDTGPDAEDGEETAVPDDDVMEDETPETADATDTATNPLKDTADSDESGDAPDVPDSDSDGADSNDTVEPGADTNDTPDAETETSLPCLPNCAGKECGDNGCDGSCGSCQDGYTCNANFVCECVVGCQIPTEPTADATDAIDADAGTDADANTNTTADTKADSTPDETGGPTAETTVTVDATVDALQSETSLPSVDTVVNAESSEDIAITEVATETVDEDIAKTAETATNEDIATETEEETETSEDASEPDTFVLPCLANPLFCDDGNECTVDICTLVGCQHVPQTGMACNDDNACTTVDTCEKDVCVGAAIICNDQNPCTDDSCDEQSGCVHTSNNANPCEDGSLCTVGDFCDAGQCQGGNALKCDDKNICTDDVCQPQKGCVYPANQAGCDDGNSCTVGDICADMACASGTNICQCQNDADCDKADDDNLCNGTIMCDKSAVPFVCITDPETIIICNANQDTACLKNTCVPDTGDCQMKAVNEGGGCDDGNACTSNDQCVSGICAGQSIKCDDSNVCTDDSCAPASGCVFTSNKADCDDGSVCTILDVCQSGQCVGTAPLDCDDGKDCTLDICHKTLGCQHSKTALNSQACDNGDACTVNDTCQNGVCQAGTQNNCECYATADCAGKEDGDFCNGTLICDTSQMPHKCVLDPATVVTCSIASDTACLINTCQPASGKCEMETVNEGEACDDGNPCTEADVCNSGVCVGTPKPSGTVIFEDNFDDGNLDGWTIETWNTCPNCNLCPCVLPTIAITDEAPFWVKMSPLAGSGHVLFTAPATFLPKGGSINFLFAGASCGGTFSKCAVQTGGDILGYASSDGCITTPPSCQMQFSITKDEETDQVMLDCAGVSVSYQGACGAVYLDNFSILCP